MERAIALSHRHGLGCVALAHTNHWMRGGSYGWQAAEAGVVGICWTNTMPNLPPWGATEPRLGNNATHQIAPDSLKETQLSQVFLAFDLESIESENARVVDQIVQYVLNAQPSSQGIVRYPGQRTLEIRKRNLAEGIPVDPQVWQQIQAL